VESDAENSEMIIMWMESLFFRFVLHRQINVFVNKFSFNCENDVLWAKCGLMQINYNTSMIYICVCHSGSGIKKIGHVVGACSFKNVIHGCYKC
jgi:hypothetical protein